MNNQTVEVSVVIPSKDEMNTIGICIKKIQEALEAHGISYEIIVADNSADLTPNIARSLGATVVTPDRMGYGYAYRYGFKYAKGKYIVIGDADNTYDFSEIIKLIEPLRNNEADIVIGSRFKGHIERGAMPWLHQYIGNPILTFFLNLFFNTSLSDAHSGFRAFKREVLETIEFTSYGMEFASEMIIKAIKKGFSIKEVPITYYPRLSGKSKLSSFSDGWRHLKFMLLFTPKYVYFIPGIFFLFFGLSMLLLAFFNIHLGYTPGIHSSILGGMFTILGYNIFIMGIFTDTYIARKIHIEMNVITKTILRKVTVEKGILIGMTLALIGFAYTIYLFNIWVDSGFRVLPIRGQNVMSITLIILGLQTIFYSVLLSLLSENI
jgi:glycosyltransferase involved in cell wall biosynthesis